MAGLSDMRHETVKQAIAPIFGLIDKTSSGIACDSFVIETPHVDQRNGVDRLAEHGSHFKIVAMYLGIDPRQEGRDIFLATDPGTPGRQPACAVAYRPAKRNIIHH